jgi:intron-binding protein aquarius
LTRTTRVGYLRDIRRMTVALSRARLGLYVLGRREVFESCYELRQAFDLLLRRPDKLVLVTGELWPTNRPLVPPAQEAAEGGEEAAAADGEKMEVSPVDENPSSELAVMPNEAVMEGVEHLGQYVFEMTNQRLAQLREERRIDAEVVVVKGDEGVVGDEEAVAEVVEDEEGEGEDEDEDMGVRRGEGFEVEED